MGGDDTIDSDADTVTGQTATFTISSGAARTDLDAAFYEQLAIGDSVWLDENSDGTFDSGERGIAGATVNLLDSSGTVIATTTTAADGSYGFTNLDPTSYQVEVLVPGFTFTGQDTGSDDTIDSDVDTATGLTALFALTSGNDDFTIDAGVLPATLGDFVWDDLDGDGLQDAGEPGLDGVTVNLLDATGTTLLDSTVTSGGGAYSFPVGPAGYVVQFVAPAGHGFQPLRPRGR